MNRSVCHRGGVSGALAAGIFFCGAHDFTSAQPPASNPARIETLSRGVVHEGFLAPIAFDPVPGLIGPEAPPAPLDEQPGALMPSGPDARWLPGYWAWRPESRDFVWTSGGWRVPPPGKRWIAGYWGKTSAGFQWTPGFWISAEASQVAYLPLPPKTKQAPNTGDVAAKSALPPNRMFIPGYWQWQGGGENGRRQRLNDERGKPPRLEGDFVWQPGYWAQAKPGWIWTPAHYAWTPAGAVFVAGFWDYPLERRGLLFAPAAVEPAADAKARVRFSPQAIVNLAAMPQHMFISAAHGHCYFGDYDPDAQSSLGMELRSAFEGGGAGVVPIESDAAGGKTSSGEPLVIPITRLARSKTTPLAVIKTDAAALRRAALAVADAREIVARRMQLEGGAKLSLSEPRLAGEHILLLPKLPDELTGEAAGKMAVGAADADRLPGIDRRRTPGTGDRNVPGLGGRKVPGVPDPLPGIGELPGADNRR